MKLYLSSYLFCNISDIICKSHSSSSFVPSFDNDKLNYLDSKGNLISTYKLVNKFGKPFNYRELCIDIQSSRNSIINLILRGTP